VIVIAGRLQQAVHACGAFLFLTNNKHVRFISTCYWPEKSPEIQHVILHAPGSREVACGSCRMSENLSCKVLKNLIVKVILF